MNFFEKDSFVILTLLAVILFPTFCAGITTRCFVCNSRGPLGDCKDPFLHNSTSFRDLPGNPVGVSSCPSGWCRKQMEIVKGPEKHGVSSERHCLQIPPPDNEERCAKVTIGNKPTLLCFCRGDLCNSAPAINHTWERKLLFLGLSLITVIYPFAFLKSL